MPCSPVYSCQCLKSAFLRYFAPNWQDAQTEIMTRGDCFTQGEIDFSSTQTRFQVCIAFLIVGSFYKIPEKGCLFLRIIHCWDSRGSLWHTPHPMGDQVNVLWGSMPWSKWSGHSVLWPILNTAGAWHWRHRVLSSASLTPIAAGHRFKLSASPWILG